MSGSTRQQPVGRINQAADGGDGDEDKDEIPSYAVLLTASVERFGVSRVRDFSINDHKVEIDLCVTIVTFLSILNRFFIFSIEI